MTDYRVAIETAATVHALDADLVAAVVEQESSGRFHAYRFEANFYAQYLAGNPMYAAREPREVAASYGLMQILYTTAVEHGFGGDPWDLFNPALSLEYGCLHLASLFTWARGMYVGLAAKEKSAVMRSALAAYNGGKKGNAPNASLRNGVYADQVSARYYRIRGGV